MQRSFSEIDQNQIILLNDPHIGASQADDAPIPSNLSVAVKEILQQRKHPAAVIINGDLAWYDGQLDDYVYFARLIQPLRDSGIAVRLTLGNHDDRAAFYQAFPLEKPSQSVAEDRYVGIVQLPFANLFLLDSLKEVVAAPGDLGARQMSWLTQSLDKFADKPALLIIHHNPRFAGPPEHFPGGLEDSEELWEIMKSRPHVKACFHGHTHERHFSEREGIHVISAPSVGYVADESTSTTGWITLQLHEDGANIITHTHRKDHEWNGVDIYMKWHS